MGQERGGRRLPCPASIAELLSNGGKLLGLAAAQARDDGGRILEEEELPFLANETVIRLHTQEDEMEYLN